MLNLIDAVLANHCPSVTTPNSAGPRTDYDFSKSQPWVRTDRSLVFLDETKELMSIYDHEPNETEIENAPTSEDTAKPIPRSVPDSVPENGGSSGQSQSVVERSNSAGQIDDVEFSSPTKRRRLTFSTSHHPSPSSANAFDLVKSPANSWHADIHTGWTPSAATDHLSDALNFGSPISVAQHHSPRDSRTAYATVSDSLSRIYLETAVWPLSSREEAWLLRYYVEHISRNFDLTDPYRHFRNVVPQQAATCPTLLNAIFALSARHLSRIGEYDPLISNRYHQECLKHLIPMLDDSAAAVLDENLFASTIILRHLEEIEVPLSGQSPADNSFHLLGAHALISAQERATMAGGLREAAFWVGLRQEIYVAFVNQRSIMPSLEHCNIDRSFGAAPDSVWSCRMVVICSDALRYCFGDGDPSTVTYNWLVESVTQWHSSKPASFTPIYYKEADHDNILPDIWFLADEIIVGWQYYYITKILLTSHNPKTPSTWPKQGSSIKSYGRGD